MDKFQEVSLFLAVAEARSFAAAGPTAWRRPRRRPPDFLARAGVPSHPDMLPRYCTVSVVMEGQMDRWRFVCDGHARDLDVQAQLTVTSSQAAVRAAVQGWGLAQVVSYQAAGALREGALQVVLREFEPPPLPVHVVYPEGRKGAAKVRSFVEFCVERLRAELGELPA
ncbi:lysR family transcriptional regulator [Bordetella pertussis]|nr:lysR family transcriptional regulator [Bordetella pertussis]